MKKLICCLLVCAGALVSVGASEEAASPLVELRGEPRRNFKNSSRGKEWWMDRHNAALAQIKAANGKFDVVMVGDSIMHYRDHKTNWPTKALFPDRIHPGAPGCRIWLDAMKPFFRDVCGR